MTRALYFAYGSNLKLARMRARVPSASPLAAARLTGWALAFDKRGGDGSGKANLREAPGGTVWGALYRIQAAHWELLDGFEPDYARVGVEVIVEAVGCVAAETYVARVTTSDPVPFVWYKRLLLEGAREHSLPDEWLDQLEDLPARADPDVS